MPRFGGRSYSILKISALLVLFALAAVQSSAGVCLTGGPQATYQFVGQCTDCSGTGVGQLTVQSYTLGTALSSCNFVSFTYSSNLRSFTITPATLSNLSGTLPSTLPAAATVSIIGSGINALSTNVNGSWGVGIADYGSSHTWSLLPVTTAVPTLSTGVLGALILLLAGAGALLARSRRTAGA